MERNTKSPAGAELPAAAERPVAAEHDSWLALDPARGCPNDCAYCFLRLEGLTRSVPTLDAAPAEELAARCAAKLRDIPPSVPVSFGNTTDLLSSERLLDCFCALASALRVYEPERLFVLITKAPVDEAAARRIAEATEGRCLFALSQSYSTECGRQFEPGRVSSPEDTLRSAAILSRTEGLRCVHFWRPFLSAWNPPERLPDRVRALRDSGCLCSVLIGLKAPQALLARFPEALRTEAEAELGRPPLRGEEYLCGELADQAIAAGAANGYPIFLHTSCAIAYADGTPDINGTARSPAAALRCRRANCPPRQRAICLADHPLEENAAYISRCREQYGERLRIRGDELLLEGRITDYEFNHLLHIFHRPPAVGALVQNKVWRGSVNDIG